jgi:hypothetical protein
MISDNKEEFIRYDKDKIDWTLIDFNSLEECVKVLAFGEKKYSRDNWKNLPSQDRITRVLPSMLRHIVALTNGEEIDSESSLSHAGHIMCNAMFYQYHMNNSK